MPEYFKSAGYTTHAIGKVRTEYWLHRWTILKYFSGILAIVTRITPPPSGKPSDMDGRWKISI